MGAPLYPALMQARRIGRYTPIPVDTDLLSGDVSNHPASVHGTYASLGLPTGTPLNSLAVYDAAGWLKDFEVPTFDGTNIEVHWRDSFVASSGPAERFLFWDPVVNPATSLANAVNVWDANHLGVWHNNQASGTILDSTSNNNDSSSNTADYGATGQIDGALDYIPGNSDETTFGDVGDNIAAITVEAWVKFDTLATNFAGVVCKASGGAATDSFFLQVTAADNQVRFRCDTDLGRNVAEALSGAILSTGTWYHIAGTWDDNTDTVSIYVDGLLKGTDTQTGNVVRNTAGLLRFGNSGYGEHHDGIIDEVRLSNTARSADWIAAEYLFGLGTIVTPGQPESTYASHRHRRPYRGAA